MVDNAKVIAVLGASGQQGAGVVRALKAQGKFQVRALTRNPANLGGVAAEIVVADLTQPETLEAAFEGAHGVFAVTNFWEPGGADEIAQGEAAVRAARQAGVSHFIWSTLPDVEAISGGKYAMPHFTNKVRVDAAVAAAAFEHHSFVVAPFYYQNLTGVLAPQPQADGSLGWTLPIDPAARVICAGDAQELGRIVAGAFADPARAGDGHYLPLVGDLLSFNDVVGTLNSQGHKLSFKQAPREVFATFFPGATELAAMFAYFEEYGYFGADPGPAAALSNRIAGATPTPFAAWARGNMPVQA